MGGLVVDMFVQGRTYSRRELHRLYGGQQQGGISTPSGQSFIMLFTGEQGQQYGYRDRWSDEGLFLYAGEGQVGDMAFVRGNRAVRDHVADGKDLHLFEYVEPGRVRYVGQMVCIGFQEMQGLDREGSERRVIVFELAPLVALGADEAREEGLWAEPLSVLRERALAVPAQAREPSARMQLSRHRSAAVRIYVLKRAGARCEGCGEEAPFRTDAGRPYLEPHHLRRLSDGGPDHPRWVAALCPNCHSRAHYSVDRQEFNEQLLRVVEQKETQASGGSP